MKRINGGGLLLAVFLLDFMGAGFAQTQATQDASPAQPPAVTAPSAVGVGATPDLSLVGMLEGRRTWIASYDRREKSAGAKLEQVKIENGKGQHSLLAMRPLATLADAALSSMCRRN